MTPMRFEAEYGPGWDAFAEQLAEARQGKPVDGALLATRYRRVCENLALAQSRAYPVHLVARLENMAQDAHQLIYRRQDYGLRRLGRLLRVELPCAVRAQGRYVWVALALFALPLLLSFLLALQGPDFALHLLDANQLRRYESMYADGKSAMGRLREAGGDWTMFGFYIFNNIGIGFRCFGAGILAGVGSAFVLVYNGLLIGAVAGHLTRVDLGHNFWPFVATHASFELTGIVLSGAAGLRLGMGWLAPGRMTRLESLRTAALAAVPLVYAAFALLLVAAAFEAFWSSAVWIAPAVKYGVAALCWALVLMWLLLAGRGATHAR
ncbi:stage II sporulation protein M [Roseateles asaccharophilus]|uniref:Membrane protein SpoIIM required for sporulation n=1 Tax=Roseateles asaccharophilus TaxID=582607 RepID=A0ABU2AI97_9BURK|nr:stage II sporulation protein M [Roseateles asaccharophilus]MDR7335703.1 putative membrane protein SpoIIM required for sporulation [Roseateles asaccharophilus]